jgi:hypothetical protein
LILKDFKTPTIKSNQNKKGVRFILCHFQQYFSFIYIVAVRFIGGENHRPAANSGVNFLF